MHAAAVVDERSVQRSGLAAWAAASAVCMGFGHTAAMRVMQLPGGIKAGQDVDGEAGPGLVAPCVCFQGRRLCNA